MRLLHHFLLSLFLSAFVYLFTKNIFASFLCFLAGFLVDADHLIDFWIYKGRITLSREIFNEFYKNFGKIYIFAHSLEFLIPLALITLYFPVYGIALLIGFLSHIITDYLTYDMHLLSYFLTYRLKRRFNIEYLCKKKDYMKNKFKHYDWEISYDVIKSLIPIHRMLDVGCGDGEKAEIHKELVKEIIGIDISYLKLKKAKNPGVQVVLSSALDLPFKDNSFDLVTSFHVIEHIDKNLVMKFINEILSVLKSNRYFIIITPNRRRLTSIANIILRLIKNNVKYPMNPDHKHEYTIEELEKLFQNSMKIKQIEIIPIGFIRLPFMEISKVPKFLEKYSDQILIIGKK